MHRLKHTLYKLLAVLAILMAQSNAGEICDGVVFMPTELVSTGAKDMAQSLVGEETLELVDVHTYNHFYTFQIDRDVNKENEGIEMRIPARKFKSTSTEGFAFRLRAEFNSAEGSRTEMGFKVQLIAVPEEVSAIGEEKKLIIEVSSLDSKNGENTALIDLPQLKSGLDYVLRYEFYQKEVVRRGNSLSIEEDTIASRDSLVQCNLPFFTQELSIVDRKVLKSRVRKHQSSNQEPEPDISQILCNFANLLATDSDGVEGGLDCTLMNHSFKLSDQKASTGINVRKLAQFPLKVTGIKDRPTTQYFQLNIGTEFAFGAGVIAIIRKSTIASETEVNPFDCLLDQSCQISKRNEKNHISLNVVLTTGDYMLQIFDQTNSAYSNMIFNDLGLEEVPVTIDIQAYPIMQNEERSTCPYMYLTQDFIQEKFIRGQNGQRFFYNDKIVLDLVNLEQRITIFPEQDSYLKVHAREAFGINLRIELCSIRSDGTSICGDASQNIGNIALLITELKKKTKNFIKLSFNNSVLAIHSFKECPHIALEISMISQSEAELMDATNENITTNHKESKSRLDIIFQTFNQSEKPFGLKEPNKSTFTFQAEKNQSFQVIQSNTFTNEVKFGVFVEIFSSPFQPEVLGLFLSSDTNNKSYEDDRGFTQNEDLLNKYKNNKAIWVDLEPGTYTLQVVCMRQTESSKISRKQSAQVTFQLYMNFEYINVAREAFIPSSFNYMGLLGYGAQSKDFGQITLFYDDVTLWKELKVITFSVASEMTSLSIQLEQDEQQFFKMFLQAESGSEKKSWQNIGTQYIDVTRSRNIQTIEVDLLVPGITYRVYLQKNKQKQQNSIESAELGEQYSQAFSLKVEFSENDTDAIAKQIRREVTQQLPKTIDSISKIKMSNPGMREASFKMGNREIIGLLESPNGKKMDMSEFKPFQPLDPRIFTSNETDKKIVVSIPFEVDTDSEFFYAGVYEYTAGVNLLSIAIFEKNSQEEVVLSTQGKYFSRIEKALLPRGSYFLVLKNDKTEGQNRLKNQAPIQFVIDVMREKSSETEDREFLEAFQLCPLPDRLSGLNRIGYLHPLSGNNLQQNMLFKLIELDSGSFVPLVIKDVSLITAYIEVSSNIDVTLSIKESGGLRKVVALSSDQDTTVQNFLKQTGFIQKHVVSLRVLLGPGTYFIEAKANSFENSNANFDKKQNFCETYLLSITISNTKSANTPFFINQEEENCNSAIGMQQRLELNKIKNGSYVADLNSKEMAVSYFDFTSDGTQGPYLFYFQLDYDLRQQGPVGLVLSQYDADAMLWKEVSLFVLSDNQSSITKVLESGTYGISIQPIVSTKLKFDSLGIKQSNLTSKNYFSSGCFKSKFTYFATSINKNDSQQLSGDSWVGSIDEILRGVLALENQDDLRDLREFAACQFDMLPQSLPQSTSYLIEITPKINSSKYEMIDFTVSSDSQLRVMVSPRNNKNQIQVVIIDNDSGKAQVLAQSDLLTKTLSVILTARRRAYRMKIIFAVLDENDICPLYDLTVALKPLKDIMKENLVCKKNILPGEYYKIEGKTYKHDRQYAFSGEFLTQLQKLGAFYYDIEVEFEHSDYNFNLEYKTDFLTTQIDMAVYFQNPVSQAYHKVAVSVEQPDLEGKGEQFQNSRSRIQKLQYLEEMDPGVDLDASSVLTLRFVIGSETFNLLNELTQRGLYKQNKPICFNFDLSIFAVQTKQPDIQNTEVSQIETKPTLMRIIWQGSQMGSKLISENKIAAFLEFDQSLGSEAIKTFKAQALFYLSPIKDNVENSDYKERIIPSSGQLSSSDDTHLRLQFKPNTLKRGHCYKLKVNKNSVFIVTPEQTDSQEMQVCMTACSCSMIGTSNCQEEDGEEPMCICRENYTGEDCNDCVEGFYKNEKGYCIVGNYCVESGGTENCNGHGNCVDLNGRAKCDCLEGFANDGLELCGRCADPLFTYPHECQLMQRQYAIVQDNYECSKMPYQMPNKLYESAETNEARIQQAKKDGDTPPEQITIYEQEGMLEWKGRYSLISPAASHSSSSYSGKNSKNKNNQMRVLSEHEFLISNTSMFRIFLSTLDSGAKVRYSIFDPANQMIFKSEEFVDQLTEFDKIYPGGEGSLNLPFKLVIEYQSEVVNKDQCPMIEVDFVITPYSFQQASLKCSKAQKELKRDFLNKMDFWSVTQIRQERVNLSSDMLIDDGSYPWLKQDSEFLYTNIELNINEPGHALSIMTAQTFANLHTTLTLKDSEGHTLLIEKTSLLGEVPESVEVYKELPSTKQNKPVSMMPDLTSRDLVSFIEVNDMKEGKYYLEIGVPISLFFKSSKYETCVDYDIVIEYISKRKLREDYDEDDEIPIQIVGITPLGMSDLSVLDKLSIQIIFDQPVDTRRIASSQSELNRVCTFQFVQSSNPTVIVPEQTFYNQNFATLNFDFETKQTVINGLFDSTGQTDICFNLVCQSEKGKALAEIFPISDTQNFRYCFKKQQKGATSILMCNGYAKPRFENGMCICTFPYKGLTCDDCEPEFEVTSVIVQKIDKPLIICRPAKGSKYENCHGFGEYFERQKGCKCDNLHAGQFCELCKDNNLQFPDCIEQIQAQVQSGLIRNFEKRRRSQVYTKDDFLLEDLENIFRQQCPLTNYPIFLNEISNHKEFTSGDFHISDYYITNHDSDNVMEFTPRSLGSLKVLVKQPEEFDQINVDESLDIEIAVAFADQFTFFKTEQNFNVDFGGKLGKQSTDFTVMYLDITEKLIDKPMLIFFRGMNYTHDDIKSTKNPCQALFIEIEFRSKDTQHKCLQDYPQPATKKNAITLQRSNGIGFESQGPMTIDNTGIEGFFFFQDYFIDQDNDSGYDLTVTLVQKFSDEVTILPIIEIRGTELEDAGKIKQITKPECTIYCEIAGHKGYNQMTLNTVVPYGTLFRVWLYKKASEKKGCLNYDLTVKHASLSNVKELVTAQSLRCEHLLDLPENLNTVRYLGLEQQQDFEYIEKFRIENLASNAEIKFKLTSNTLVRFEGLQHKQIKFNLSLMKNKQVLGITLDKQLPLDQGIHEPESIVFSALPAGDYKLKIQFINSQMQAISQPCQSIQLHLAMSQISNITKVDDSKKIQTLSLQNIMDPSKNLHYFQFTPSAVESVGNELVQGFDIIFENQFKLEEKEGINLFINSRSDFLGLDVSFILINKQTNHVYSPQSHTEDKKRLLILDIPGGIYKLVVFTKKCDVRTNDRLLLTSVFKMSMHLYSFDQPQKTQVTTFPDSQNTAVTKKINVDQKFTSPEKLMCKNKYHSLPADLIEDNVSLSLDFQTAFSVNGEELAFGQKKLINYVPPPFKDALRIQITDGIKLQLFYQKEYNNGGDPLGKSHFMLGNQFGEMVVTGLKSGVSYIIEMTFGGDEFSSCLHGSMQVLIAKTSDFKCVKKETNENNQFELGKDDTVNTQIASTNPSDLDATSTYQVTLKEDNTDLEVSLDYSNTLFGARLFLLRQEQAQDVLPQTHSSENQQLVNQVAYSDGMKVKSSSTSNFKHQIKYSFNNLKKGIYALRVVQPSKTDFSDGCHDFLSATFRTSTAIDFLLDGANLSVHQPIKFQSKIGNSDVIKRLPISLPLDLNSFRYLGGGVQEKKYLLFSDLIELSPDDTQNKISLEVTEEGTKVRVYFEDSSIAVKTVLEGDESLKRDNFYGTGNIVQFNAKVGKYSLYFEHYTEEAKKRRLYFKDSVQITILVVEPDFIDKQYFQNMKDALSGCENSAFPLALAKKTQFNVVDEQSYYNYPLLRVVQNHDEDLATYSFRFNETQRVYFELGSNFLSSHAILKLSPKSSRTRSYIVGKQNGNLNVIDMMVPPGDYQLIVKNYNSDMYQCGVFSMRGLLNQKSAMVAELPVDARGFMSGTSQCEVIGDTPPSIIYGARDQASAGNEEYINDEGAYFKAINDVLIVKSHREVLQPWTHEVEVSTIEQSFLKVLIQAEVAEKMSVRLVTSFGSPLEPSFTNLRQSQTGFEVLPIKELTYLFQLNPNQQYFIVIEFFGDMFNSNFEEEDCAYFNLVISINSMQSLYSKMSCSAEKTISKFGNLFDSIPSVIQEGKHFTSDKGFEEKGLYTLKYPEDFTKLKYGSDSIMVSQRVEAKSPFTVGGQVYFELPFSDWQLSMYNVPDVPKTKSVQTREEFMLEIELLSDAGILESSVITDSKLTQDNKQSSGLSRTNMRRVMQTLIVSPEAHEDNLNLMIVFEESQASTVLKSVQSYALSKQLSEQLCIPVGIQLQVKTLQMKTTLIDERQEAQVVAFRLMHGANQSTMSIYDLSNSQEYLPYSTKYISLAIQLNREPLDNADLKSVAQLNIISDNKVIASVIPLETRINTEGKEAGYGYILVAKFTLNLTRMQDLQSFNPDNIKMQVSINPEKIIEKENNPKIFRLSADVSERLHTWSIPIQASADQITKQQIKQKEKGSELKDDIAQVIKSEDTKTKKEQTVKCLCVNGTCKKGESSCSECSTGWEGVLCDIPKKSLNKFGKRITIEDQDEIDEIFNAKKTQDKSYDRQQDEVLQKPKYTEIKMPNVESIDSTEVISLQSLDQKQSFVSWVFFSFCELVKKSLYVFGLFIVLYLLKMILDKIEERMSREKLAKDRKKGAKAKRGESDYEGVRFSDDSEDDESGLVAQPIELTTIRKKKPDIKTVRKSLQSFNSAADSESEEESSKLKLFSQEQDQPMTQQHSQIQEPQEMPFNPFGQEVMQEVNHDKQGDAILNELDDALNDLSSDDDNEFQSFV